MNAVRALNNFPVMPRFCAAIERGLAGTNVSPARVRGTLMLRGLTIADWAKMAGYKTATPVSLAIHHRRNDARSKAIRAQLFELVNERGAR